MRNRLRRIGKEMFRQSKSQLPTPCADIALSLNTSILRIAHAERKEMFIALVQKLTERITKNG